MKKHLFLIKGKLNKLFYLMVRKVPGGTGERLKYTLLRFLPIVLTISLVFVLIFNIHMANSYSLVEQRELNKINIQKNFIHNEFRFIVSDLLNLSEATTNEIVHESLRDGLNELKKDYSFLVKNKKIYDKVALFDLQGKEIIRVNYNYGDLNIVEDDQLQFKGNRYYFLEAKNLKPGEVYVSPLDLNFEYGKIEKPLKPVMRFVTPVIDADGHKMGYIVLYYKGENLVKELEKFGTEETGEFILLNSDGYWLHSQEPENEWGFIVDKEKTYKAAFPAEWLKLDMGESGQFYSQNGLITYNRISPFGEVYSALQMADKNNITSFNSLKDYRWILISKLDNKILNQNKIDIGKLFLILFISFSLILFVILWLMGKLNYLRKEAEKNNEENKLKYVSLFNNMNEGLIYFQVIKDQAGNPMDFVILDLNDSFEKIIGIDKELIIGKRVTEVEDLRDFRIIKETFNYYSLETDNKANLDDYYSKVLDKWYSVSVFSPQDEHLLITFFDISERIKIDAELAKLDRLNMLGEVAAGIGHEIRNPMTTVRGFLQLIMEKNQAKENDQAFSLMIQELDRANLIITEFLSLAKNKTVQLRLSNLNQVVEAILPLIQAEAMIADKFVEIILGDIPEILLDEKEIRQLLLNLALNGLDAMEAKGCLKVKTYLMGQEVILEVEDDGKGIPSNIMEKIGVPFFTTKDEGVGLGLAVCYSIAQRHNARIKVESSSAGTRFIVCFQTVIQ